MLITFKVNDNQYTNEETGESRSPSKSAARRHLKFKFAQEQRALQHPTKGAPEYSIVRNHSNHFIHEDLMPCSKLT